MLSALMTAQPVQHSNMLTYHLNGKKLLHPATYSWDRVMFLLIALLRSLGYKQILKLPLGFSLTTREFTQSVG